MSTSFQIVGAGQSLIIVDDDMLELVKTFKWRKTVKGYVIGRVDGTSTSLHRFILGIAPLDPIQVDHINGNRSDCRRANLRCCSSGQNAANRRKINGTSSQFKGVTYKRGRWEAQIKTNRKTLYLGRYVNELEAARAYDEKARELFGEFSWTNSDIARMERGK